MGLALFPGLHELLIIVGRESGDEFVGGGSNSGVAVSNSGEASIDVFRKLNGEPARCYAGQNLQHFNKRSFRLVTRDVPNCFFRFLRRDKHAVAFGNPRGTDNKGRQPTLGPFGFTHGAQKREDFCWRGLQTLSATRGWPISSRNSHLRKPRPPRRCL